MILGAALPGHSRQKLDQRTGRLGQIRFAHYKVLGIARAIVNGQVILESIR